MRPDRPVIPLQDGEQYRFHFDAGKCIGCKCCEVACHEQNNTPPDVSWRKVGEIEGGEFPNTARLYISMACNHCVEPACLKGCPVDAYYKDTTTGIVLMKEDMCIGCGYCTWNCPYEAPQFTPERHMVTKCDLCHNRLAEGNLPACVNACPSGALEIETVKLTDWVADYALANAPGVPDASMTISTTRITLPTHLPPDLGRADEYRLKPEKPHYSLVFMLVLTQLSVGGFLSLFLTELLLHWTHLSFFLQDFLKIAPAAMLGTAALALSTSVFHLGRPIFAYRALKMWKRSWLSREVLFFALFAKLAALYSVLAWIRYSFPAAPIPAWGMIGLGACVAATGIAGIYSSARIYMVPARPSWNNSRTPIAFFSTAFLLGPLFTFLIFSWQFTHTPLSLLENGGGLVRNILIGLIVGAGLLQLGAILIKLFYILSREESELRGTARLLTQWFRVPFLLRLACLVLAAVSVPLAALGLVPKDSFIASSTPLWIAVILVLALTGELLGRYLFFVTVVPKNRPEGYFA